MSPRAEIETVARWITPGSRVLDLGCGEGELLDHLARSKQVRGLGVEIDGHKVVACIERGVSVIQSDLDDGLLRLFEPDSFDCVVLTETLQAMWRPDHLVAEIVKIGREAIVTFPNMAHWRNRWQFVNGRMPVTRTLPYQWFDTPNIHLCTLADFEDMCRGLGLSILDRAIISGNGRKPLLGGLAPNLLAELALYRIARMV